MLDDRIKNVEAKFVSVDEMFGFVGCLQQNTTVDDMVRGDQYVFLGIEQTSKLIICWTVGKRDRFNARDIMAELKAKTTGRFQLTTDNFNAYSGWGGAVRKAFGGQIDYGTLPAFRAGDGVEVVASAGTFFGGQIFFAALIQATERGGMFVFHRANITYC